MKIAFELSWRTTLRWLLALLLIWAALSKLANLQEFYGALLAYKLPLPELLLRLVAITLPWLELLCGLMLAAKVWIRAVLAWAALLFATFTLATGQAWIRGLDISCGCLNLSLLGLSSNFLESAGFAFFRALLLTVIASYLLRHQAEDRAGAPS